MKTLALICEGVSETKILTYIINRYLGDGIVVNPIQPSLKAVHGQQKQASEGGWLQVLNHCSDDVIQDIMAANLGFRKFVDGLDVVGKAPSTVS